MRFSNSRTKNFFICITSDCPRRKIDTKKIYNYFIANGFSFTKNYKKADLVVLVTCAFVKDTEDISIHWLEYFSKHKSESSRIIVAGCLPKINPIRLSEIGAFETLLPRDLNRIDDIIGGKVKFESIPDPNEELAFSLYVGNFVKRDTDKLEKIGIDADSYDYPDNKYDPKELFTIEIALGCLGKCSYCAIKFAAGKTKSKPKVQVIKEFRAGLDRGYKKFVIIAGDIGAYGVDIGSNIVELLAEIFKVEGEYKLFLMEFNAQWLVKYYEQLGHLFSKHHDKIDCIIIPIQSGSDKILRLMRRSYKIDDVKSCLRQIRVYAPRLKMTTAMMVGFPGESEDDFKKSKEIIEHFDFSFVDVYGYQDRPNTESSTLSGKIPRDIIHLREVELRKIGEETYKKTHISVSKSV